MFRNLWGHIAQEEKEGHAPQRSVITKGRDARSLPWRHIPSSELSRSVQGKKDTWWEVCGKKSGGKGQRDQRLRGERCEGKKTHHPQRRLYATVFHLIDCVLNREMDEGINNTHAGWLRPQGLGCMEKRQKVTLTRALQRWKERWKGPSVLAREGKMKVGTDQLQGRSGGKQRERATAGAGVSSSSVAGPRPLTGLPYASHSKWVSVIIALAVYSQGWRKGSGWNIEGPLTHESGPKCTPNASSFAAVCTHRILRARMSLHWLFTTDFHVQQTLLGSRYLARHEECRNLKVPVFWESTAWWACKASQRTALTSWDRLDGRQTLFRSALNLVGGWVVGGRSLWQSRAGHIPLRTRLYPKDHSTVPRCGLYPHDTRQLIELQPSPFHFIM